MPTESSHPLLDVKDAVAEFISNESELAAAELKPAAKAAGISAGLFAAAGVFLFHVIWMLVIIIALALGLLLYVITPIGPWGSFTLGFVASMLFSLLVAAGLAFAGKKKWKGVKKPEATIAEAKATLSAISDALSARKPGSDVVIKAEDLPQFRDADLEKTFGRP